MIYATFYLIILYLFLIFVDLINAFATN